MVHTKIPRKYVLIDRWREYLFSMCVCHNYNRNYAPFLVLACFSFIEKHWSTLKKFCFQVQIFLFKFIVWPPMAIYGHQHRSNYFPGYRHDMEIHLTLPYIVKNWASKSLRLPCIPSERPWREVYSSRVIQLIYPNSHCESAHLSLWVIKEFCS